MMFDGEGLTRWTVRIALGLYVWTEATNLLAGQVPKRHDLARLSWTVGCLFFLAHVASAFQFYHGWSHSAAYRETARRTAELFGFSWGGGIYFNYAFTLAWAGDVTWWWLGPESYRNRYRSLDWFVHGFFAFMAFNATVLFETGLVRWLGLAAALGLGVLWFKSPSQ